MENIELINIWKEQNAKIEKTLAINKRLLKETIGLKAESALGNLVKLKTAGIIAFVIYLILLGYALVYAISNYSSANNYFIVSMSAIALINLKGFTDYIKHLAWTKNINYNGSVMEIQKQLSKLQLSIINHSKIMVLQFPFWTTFYLSNRWFPQDVGLPYIIFQIAITGSFTYLTYWLYKIHKPENLSKKWFRNLIAGSGGKSVEKALEFYKEMEEFEKEN
ncbi:MAG: hypothetical protein WC389_12160 [Lutibacter sp.]|jgi:uncharacterized membrane protein